jgi:hypothetical protein
MKIDNIMSESKVLTVRVSAEDYDRLATEARRVNLSLDALAYGLLKSSIDGIKPSVDKEKAKSALAGLRSIARNLPPVDAVTIARESREELEQRGTF